MIDCAYGHIGSGDVDGADGGDATVPDDLSAPRCIGGLAVDVRAGMQMHVYHAGRDDIATDGYIGVHHVQNVARADDGTDIFTRRSELRSQSGKHQQERRQ